MSFHLETTIRRPPEAVFAYLEDVERTALWYEAVQQVDKVGPPPSRDGSPVGTTYRFVRTLPGGTVENLVQVSGYRPNTSITFRSVDGPTPFTYRYDVTPAPEGTRLALHGSIRADGLTGPARMLGPLAPRLFARGMAANLGTLRHLLENGDRPKLPRRI